MYDRAFSIMVCTQTKLNKCYICSNNESTNVDVLWEKIIARYYRILVLNRKWILTPLIVVDRLFRSREGFENFYHGKIKSFGHDLELCSDLGKDSWKYILKSGFTQPNFNCIDSPAGIAIGAKVGDEE